MTTSHAGRTDPGVPDSGVPDPAAPDRRNEALQHGDGRAAETALTLSALQRNLSHHMGDEGGWYSDTDGGSDAEPWQITYLDTITLLLILFILLSALQPVSTLPRFADTGGSSESGGEDRPERRTLVDLNLPMMEPVPGSVVQPPVAVGPRGLSDDDIAALSQPQPTDEAERRTETDGTGAEPARDLRDDVSALIAEQNLQDSVDLSLDSATVSITMRDALLFPSGRDALTPEGADILADVAPLLTTIDGEISIEGHTDPVPISTAQFPSNWHLSTARAVSVLRELIGEGVPAETLRAVGHADTRPVADNTRADGRARNRRVSIVVTMATDDHAGGIPDLR
ncbi:OmpA family protein [Fodinicurvata sp. EGI_FJ10296]|uniref:OmpA/MotB family protein n=1 Tax=Fodinicurvata sp. EGI_FJ10296 TaxID=3231908 RepID=UPI003452897F